MALITPVTQPLTALQAGHLLRRATFGPSPAQIKTFTGLTPAVAVARLLAETPAPDAPLNPTTGKTFVDIVFDTTLDGAWRNYLKNWYIGQMVREGASLRESMTLFWQNHFVSTLATVGDARFIHRQYITLRKNAFGNFRTFVIEMTKDPSMLLYLNGNQNVVNSPNENYGRELQELFTIGRGGNYTEDDVKASARVLTGWNQTGYRNTTTADITTTFTASRHDTNDKKFSAAYGNTVIKGRTGATAGDDELADLVDMILKQPETARFICRKLYRWFINDTITTDIETNFIGPLAQVFINGKFELKPVLTALLTSQHFYDASLIGAIIKSPLQLIVGAFRQFEIALPDPVKDPVNFNNVTNSLLARAREQTQEVLEQPTVFGWPAYYDTGFYQKWISANTLALRAYFTDLFGKGSIRVNNVRYGPDSLAIVRALPTPADPVKLIDDLTSTLFAVPLTTAQKDFLIDNVLLPGLPRYEWTNQWQEFMADQSNAKKTALTMKTDALFLYLFRMAEYQMC
jgi:hypothetical protein